jgi:hypothetical protein
MKISKYAILVTITLVVVLFFFLRLTINHNKQLKEITGLYKVAQDSITTYRNSLGQQVAKTSVLEVTNQKNFLQLRSKDSAIQALQLLVKNESKKRHDIEVAMVVYQQTVSSLKDSIKNKIIGQIIEHKGDSVFIWPTYSRTIADKWIKEEIKIGRSSFDRSLVVHNEYQITIGSEPDGWFKRKQYAQVVSLNPASETVDMKVYQKKKVPSKFLPFLEGGIVGAGIIWLVKSL